VVTVNGIRCRKDGDFYFQRPHKARCIKISALNVQKRHCPQYYWLRRQAQKRKVDRKTISDRQLSSKLNIKERETDFKK
jgi:hypothetical protein